MSESSIVKIGREELYQRIWKISATKVAAQIGISDVNLLIICRKHQIPKPSNAHWISVARGKPSEQPPLLKAGDGVDEIIEIDTAKKIRPMSLAFLKSRSTPKLAEAVKPEPEVVQPIQITIPDTLRSPLPPIERTNLCLRDGKAGSDGLISLFGKTGCLNVTVSREQIGRAMRFLDTLFKAAISRGMKIRVADEDRKKVTLLTVNKIDLKIRMYEMCSQREKKLSAADKARYESYGKESARHYLFEKYARGDLFLGIEGTYGIAKS